MLTKFFCFFFQGYSISISQTACMQDIRVFFPEDAYNYYNSCQKISFAVDRKLMKSNLDILMPWCFVFKISYDNVMRRLIIIQGSNILPIFTHGNMQNLAINIWFFVMHMWFLVSDSAWVTPTSSQQMHSSFFDMEMHTPFSQLC